MASISEYVASRSGILFDSTVPDALREALAIARNKNLEEMGKNAHERVAKMRRDDFAANHAKVYALLTGARRHRRVTRTLF
jgi:hypothetical protein